MHHNLDGWYDINYQAIKTVDAACHVAPLWASTQSDYHCIVLTINDYNMRHTRRSSSSILHLFGYADL
jgi:hypothetical protein